MNPLAILFITAGALGLVRSVQTIGSQTITRSATFNAPRGNSDMTAETPNVGQQPTTTTFNGVYEKEGAIWNVNPRLLKAIAIIESGENPQAVNPSDPSFGLMQILCTPDGKGGCSNRFNIQGWPPETSERLFEPMFNVKLAAQILAWNLDQFGYPRGVAVYNAWSARHDSDGNFRNQEYVDSVRRQFTNLGGGAPRDGTATIPLGT